jgi:hypothetical protein
MSRPAARVCPFSAQTSGFRRSKSISTGCRDGAERLELVGLDALAAREALRERDRRREVHAGAEDAVARAGEHRAADLGVARDALPGCGERAQRRRVEGVRPLGAVDGDERDVGTLRGELESDCHRGLLCGFGGMQVAPDGIHRSSMRLGSHGPSGACRRFGSVSDV